MAGGVVGGSFPDDPRVGTGDIVWRLISSQWYCADPNIPNSPREIVRTAFSGDVSVLRQAVVTESLVNTACNGKFAQYGILELKADDIRNLGLVFEHEHDPEWGTDAHFLLRRVGGSKTQPKLQQLNNTQKAHLANLANRKPLRRYPP
ncbi:MAG: hypothetical protein ACREQI_00795 [Candidatus Binataceae bacterium]